MDKECIFIHFGSTYANSGNDVKPKWMGNGQKGMRMQMQTTFNQEHHVHCSSFMYSELPTDSQIAITCKK